MGYYTLRARILNPIGKFSTRATEAQQITSQEIAQLKAEHGPNAEDEIRKKEGVIEFLKQMVEQNFMLCGGLINGCKTYLAFCKLALAKLVKQKQTIGTEALKTLINSNKEVISRLARLAMPLLMLFDNMNGVDIDTKFPYTYDENNFELIQDEGAQKLVPKQELLEDFLRRASNVDSEITYCAESTNPNKDELATQTLIGHVNEHRFKTEGCIAIGELMDRFFDQMDAMIGKVVDMHFAVAS